MKKAIICSAAALALVFFAQPLFEVCRTLVSKEKPAESPAAVQNPTFEEQGVYKRQGIDTVLIPKENVKDLEDVPQNVREAMTIVPAEDVHTVLETALCSKPKAKE